MLGALGKKVLARDQHEQSQSGLLREGRRNFLAVVAGGIAAVVARRLFGKSTPIRPPGAVDEGKFPALCARCGNCVRVCPQKVIHPDLGRTGLAGCLTPVVVIEPGYCSEICNACNEVCPSGAIKRIPLSEKQRVAIGTAEVRRSRCLAWAAGQYCMVCGQYCPYRAVESIDRDGVPCPEVDAGICRGCGLCQTECPASPKAIIVRGREQKRLVQVDVGC